MSDADKSMRVERDSFGPIDVPASRLWGAQTQRSLLHFAISGERQSLEIIRALARVKRALAGAFIRELGPAASVLEARVQDCVNLVVLHNVLQEITALVAERKNAKAAERIRAIVRDHGLK